MCSSKTKSPGSNADIMTPTSTVSDINGRPVLQHANCNRVPLLERRNSVKKSLLKCSSLPVQRTNPQPINANTKTRPNGPTTPPASPKLRSPRPPAVKRSNDPSIMTSSIEKLLLTPRSSNKLVLKRSKKEGSVTDDHSVKYSSASIVESPGSIAAARREQVAIMQEQRKMRIAHYGRTNSAKYLLGKDDSAIANGTTATAPAPREEKRCSFITANSDPIYVAYHDEEWGVPVHDDKLLFELLALTGAQVGSDWTSVLKRRQDFRDAFSGFDAETVSKFSEKKIVSISADYGIEIGQVRGIVDNSKRILEVKKAFGSFEKYLWGFVNHKPVATQYKACHKIPVKTSKSESISKDMVRRGFRLVGPTVIHSFMQAAGLTNDHLITCPRHAQCVVLASGEATL